MRSLTLSDLKLGLADLLDRRQPALRRSAAGAMYEPMLAARRDAIDALPPALVSGLPLADVLATTDVRHDGFGGAVYHQTESYLRAPSVAPDVVAAARRIRATFIPALAELQASYADEARKATEREKILKDHKADLKRFPVADGTLYDWVKGYLEAGIELDTLLSERADNPRASRKDAAKLRSSTIGLLGRLRGALLDELEHNPKLPPDLERQVFAYLDQLALQRETAGAAVAAPPAPVDPPAPKPVG